MEGELILKNNFSFVSPAKFIVSVKSNKFPYKVFCRDIKKLYVKKNKYVSASKYDRDTESVMRILRAIH